MSGAIPPLLQYAFMAWCPVKAQGQLYLLPFLFMIIINSLIVQDLLDQLTVIQLVTFAKWPFPSVFSNQNVKCVSSFVTRPDHPTFIIVIVIM
jgi:hypothetical protein